MEIQNEALRRMFEEAKKNKALQQTENKIEVTHIEEDEIQLPQIVESPKEVSTLTSLSLNLDESLDKGIVMGNVSLEPRQIKTDPDKLNKARRKVGRLTTGASAAVPLLCKGASCPFKAKCLPGYTLIFTPNGYKRLEDLYAGDSIYSLSRDGYIEVDTITSFINSGIKTTYTVTTSYGLTLNLTDEHPVLTTSPHKDNFYKTIKEGLTVGDTIFVIDPEIELSIYTDNYGDCFEDTIIDIVRNKEEKVYDISVKNNHNFFANNITVHNCHYYEIGAHEVGENCLVEEQLIEYWTNKYLDELQIDYNSISEMHFLSRLVEITIMDLRMTNYISINDQDLMMDFVSSIDPNGSAITNKGTSVAFEIKERLEKQKIKILESLNSTRDKKAKLMLQVKEVDNSHSQKSLLEKLDKLTERLTVVKDVNSGTIINI